MNNLIIEGRALALPLDNIDTDQIIAAQHLKVVNRAGLGKHAFAGMKASLQALSDPAYARAPILVSGRNFGCGSSREHAVWALMDRGVKAVIAKSFSDIFAGNAFKCGLVTLELSDDLIAELLRLATQSEITINLAQEMITIEGRDIPFTMDAFRRECLLSGLDEIGLTLSLEQEIAEFEGAHPSPVL